MNLGELLLKLGPVLIVGAIVAFVAMSNPRQRIVVLLAWLFPGLGHWWIGRRDRALFFIVTLVPTFLAGMILSDFLSVSPFDRHPIWGLAQIPGGLLTVVSWLGSMSLVITRDNPFYQVGNLYVGCACLLNILAMCDVWDLTEDPERRAEREAKAKEAGKAKS